MNMLEALQKYFKNDYIYYTFTNPVHVNSLKTMVSKCSNILLT